MVTYVFEQKSFTMLKKKKIETVSINWFIESFVQADSDCFSHPDGHPQPQPIIPRRRRRMWYLVHRYMLLSFVRDTSVSVYEGFTFVLYYYYCLWYLVICWKSYKFISECDVTLDGWLLVKARSLLHFPHKINAPSFAVSSFAVLLQSLLIAKLGTLLYL